jgi:pimeloyl-ACP methyl ester carboxylesterase
MIQATTRCLAPVSGRKIFYRKEGNRSRLAFILLYGFPSSSFMFHNLIARLTDCFDVIRPDYIDFRQLDARPATMLASRDDARTGLLMDPVMELFTASVSLS